MSSMAKFVVIISGIIVLLNLGGIETNTGGIVKGFLDDGLSNFATSSFWSDLVEVLSLAAVASIVAGLFNRSVPTDLLIAGLVAGFGGLFLFDVIGLYSMLWDLGTASGDNWIQGVASAIFIPLTLGFFIIFINWWRNSA